MRSGDFSKKIIDWYREHHRDLPWRKDKDPYQIWLSEVMLQQTRVAQGLPYYVRFIRDFPNVQALANAPQQKVLRAWQGLGYYSRARNLHNCAKKISSQYGGKFPHAVEELVQLPGIGNYTAAAIASMAFDQPASVVDGNVYRVLSRIFGIDSDVSSAEGKKVFGLKAQELINAVNPGMYNQAVMEFGALCCTPKNPNCEACIFSRRCFAKRHDMVNLLPVKSKKVKVRRRHFTYFVFMKGNKLALRKRKHKDIWNGLYDFYLFEGSRPKKTEQVVSEDVTLKSLPKAKRSRLESRVIKHVLTHQTIHTRFVTWEVGASFPEKKLLLKHDLKFYSPKQISSLPKPRLITRFLEENGYLE